MWSSTGHEQCVLGEFGVEMTKGFMPHEVTLCLSFGVLQEGTLEHSLGYLRSRLRLKFSRWDLWLHSCSSASSCHSGYLFHLNQAPFVFLHPNDILINKFTSTQRRGNLPSLWGLKPCWRCQGCCWVRSSRKGISLYVFTSVLTSLSEAAFAWMWEKKQLWRCWFRGTGTRFSSRWGSVSILLMLCCHTFSLKQD